MELFIYFLLYKYFYFFPRDQEVDFSYLSLYYNYFFLFRSILFQNLRFLPEVI